MIDVNKRMNLSSLDSSNSSEDKIVSLFKEHYNGTNKSNTEEEECDRNLDFVSSYLWKIVPPILLLFGVTGNILAIILLKRLGLGRQPTLTFLVFLAVTDTVVLLTGLPEYWIKEIADINIKAVSNVSCKLYYFIIYLSMQYSSWILVGVATERLVKTYFPFRYKHFYTSKKVCIGLSITLFVLVIVNVHFFFTNGINVFTRGECSSLNEDFEYFDDRVFVVIDFVVLCAVPFLIMFVCNIFLVRILRNVQHNRLSMMHISMVSRANRFSVRMTKMLVVCTIYFLVATAPVSIYFILDTDLRDKYKANKDCDALSKMQLVNTITYLIQFTNYCINFYLYIAMNDRFRMELQNLLQCKTSFRGSTAYTNRQGSSSTSLAKQSVTSLSAGLEENSLSEENRI